MLLNLAIALLLAAQLAPEIRAPGANGKTVRLSDYRGKVVVLNFWATWCGGCKQEIPWLLDFENKYGKSGLEVVGVSMDEGGWKVVKPFLLQKAINYAVVLGSEWIAKEYRVGAMPKTFLIDRKGRIALSHTGVVDRAAFEAEIRKLLRERGTVQ